MPAAPLLASPARRGALMVASAAVLWGTWSIALRPAGLDSRWNSPLVMLAVALGAVPFLRGKVRARTPTRGEWWLMALLGLLDALNVLLFFSAMARTTVSIAVLSHYLAPVLIPLFAPRVAGTPKQPGAVGRSLVAAAGLALVLEPWRMGPASGALAGALLGAGSAVFYALNVCLTRRLTASFAAEEILVFHTVVSVVLLFAVAPWGAPPAARGAAVVLAAGLVIGVSAGVLFTRGISRIAPEHAALLTFLEPITAVLVGLVYFGEPLRPLALVGALVVLGAGVAAARAGARAA